MNEWMNEWMNEYIDNHCWVLLCVMHQLTKSTDISWFFIDLMWPKQCKPSIWVDWWDVPHPSALAHLIGNIFFAAAPSIIQNVAHIPLVSIPVEGIEQQLEDVHSRVH